MITWEYITTPLLLHKETAILNTWGSEGWELVQVVNTEVFVDADNGQEEDAQGSEVVEVLFNYFFKRSID